jgi:two-component system, OmpR family, phosphate regulon response regulator PhoB
MSAGDRMSAAAILVVEHDPEIGVPLVDQLIADGYRARLARSAEHARALARAELPKLAILGELEARPGALGLLAEIRGVDGGAIGAAEAGWPRDLPAIVVSSQAQEPDLLRAFAAGADDFLARPVGYMELRARLRAVLHRAERRHEAQPMRVGSLAIDVRAHTVSLDGHAVELRRLEYELLLELARDPERVCTKQELLRAVWGQRAAVCTRTLDSHASRLRRRLGMWSAERWVVNVRGVGYRLR